MVVNLVKIFANRRGGCGGLGNGGADRILWVRYQFFDVFSFIRSLQRRLSLQAGSAEDISFEEAWI